MSPHFEPRTSPPEVEKGTARREALPYRPDPLPGSRREAPVLLPAPSSLLLPRSGLLPAPAAKRLLFPLLFSSCSLLHSADAPAPAPAMNWVLPIFTDKEGFRSMTLRGSEVRPVGKNIAVTDISITIFSGDAAAQVDSILLSPAAVFIPKENRAHGDKAVRLIRDDIEVIGTGWTFHYEEKVKKVSLQQDVRVTFRAQLNDILK